MLATGLYQGTEAASGALVAKKDEIHGWLASHNGELQDMADKAENSTNVGIATAAALAKAHEA